MAGSGRHVVVATISTCWVRWPWMGGRRVHGGVALHGRPPENSALGHLVSLYLESAIFADLRLRLRRVGYSFRQTRSMFQREPHLENYRLSFPAVPVRRDIHRVWPRRHVDRRCHHRRSQAGGHQRRWDLQQAQKQSDMTSGPTAPRYFRSSIAPGPPPPWTRCAKAASMNKSISPSSTPAVSDVSTPVRMSLTIW
jgi:hypothetical protein